MGLASYFEDINTHLEEYFEAFESQTSDISKTEVPDLEQLGANITKLKLETKSLLSVVREKISETLSDPNFDAFGEWQDSLTENLRLKADKQSLSGKLDLKSQETEQMRADSLLWKNQLSQSEQIALESLSASEAKDKELLAIHRALKLYERELVSLSQENARLIAGAREVFQTEW